MSTGTSQTDKDMQEVLRQKFPELEPLRGRPTLVTWNGIGFGVYGRRDEDRETGTYVKTHCLCVLFMPLLALGAYRIADAPRRGWFFLGRVPLSPLAKTWNLLMGCAVLVLAGWIWWLDYSGSPEYRTGRLLAEAQSQVKEKRYAEAVQGLKQVADSNTSHRSVAQADLKRIYTQDILALPQPEALEILRFALHNAGRRNWWCNTAAVVQQAKDLVEARKTKEPRFALTIVDLILPHAQDDKHLLSTRAELLRVAAKAHPDDPDLVSAFAVVLEREKKSQECEAALARVADKLETREGARILGQIYSQQGKYDQAYPLLMPYCQGRLAGLHAAEKRFNELNQRVVQDAINRLKAGQAGATWYAAYDKGDKKTQQTMVQTYVDDALKANKQMTRAQADLVAHATVVPVALDLGIIMLHRAQGLPAAARTKELEAAEKIFVGIQGIAGESDEYRIFYGQVLYWLGKHKEGRKRFDAYLAAQKRSAESLLAVASILRRVGAISEARALAEESYKAADDAAKKQAAARVRAVMHTDVEDEILWLKRSDLTSQENRAALVNAEANRAAVAGDDKTAAAKYREAVALYTSAPKSVAALNNAALACISLHNVTGAPADYAKGVALMEKAVALAPSNSVLLFNTAHLLGTKAVLQLTQDQVDYKALRLVPGLSMISYLYKDQAERDALIQRLKGLQDYGKTISAYQKVLLLAPKGVAAYDALKALYSWTEDVAALRALKQKVRSADLDLATYAQDVRAFYAGKSDGRSLQATKTQIGKYTAILAALPLDKDPVTRAIACDKLHEQQIIHAMLGHQGPKADVMVDQTRALYEKRASIGTRHALAGALLYRASQRQAEALPAYRTMVDQAKRGLGFLYTLPLAAERLPALRQRLQKDADCQEALRLLTLTARDVPRGQTVWQWALAQAVNSDQAKLIAQALHKDEVHQLGIEIDAQLHPLSGVSVVSLYWLYRVRGEDDKAARLLRQAAKDGVPLPWVP